MLVKTNIGEIPLEDYLDIKARQSGFSDYEDMKSNGFTLDVPSCVVAERSPLWDI